ncbi:hypothetical protein BT96DRAFT_929779 [Gymnopus androsaceus JB14]|uniref:Uncharacterized protein n=1 Tax=Gymnopus androsaceus JB14 TaxID=1447944 RepID=A0A6A4GDI0_9AGAR|nr:hypothetical protein BT96DRAFT_929779 [Gymnopus androsaceus JB14]
MDQDYDNPPVLAYRNTEPSAIGATTTTSIPRSMSVDDASVHSPQSPSSPSSPAGTGPVGITGPSSVPNQDAGPTNPDVGAAPPGADGSSHPTPLKEPDDKTLLSTPTAAAQIPLPNPPTFASLFLAAQRNEENGPNDYNLPFLDLHYYGGNEMNLNLNHGHGHGGGGGIMPPMWGDSSGGTTLDSFGASSWSGSSRQALDLAQTYTRAQYQNQNQTGARWWSDVNSMSSLSPPSSPTTRLAGRRMTVHPGGGGTVGTSVGATGSPIPIHDAGKRSQMQARSPAPGPPARSHSLSHSHSHSHSQSSASQSPHSHSQSPHSHPHSPQQHMSMLNHHPSSHPGHQRGQSTASILSGSSGNGNSVCPQDLILRRESGSEQE